MRSVSLENITELTLTPPAMTLSNVTAGADTTAGQLSGLWHLLLKNAHVLEKLQQEIDEYESEGKLSRPITVKESQSMPYLQAVINEGLR